MAETSREALPGHPRAQLYGHIDLHALFADLPHWLDGLLRLRLPRLTGRQRSRHPLGREWPRHVEAALDWPGRLLLHRLDRALDDYRRLVVPPLLLFEILLF